MKSVESKRIFLALDLAEVFSEEAEQILLFARTHYPEVSWVMPENFHTTFHFFGDTPVDELVKIQALIQGVVGSCEPFQIQLSGLGFFPNARNPKVVWAGMAGDLEHLKRTQLKIEKMLKDYGYVCEDRPYIPHITLARIKTPIRLDFQRFEKISDHVCSAMKTIRDLTLFESVLSSSGARYHALQKFSFLNSDSA